MLLFALRLLTELAMCHILYLGQATQFVRGASKTIRASYLQLATTALEPQLLFVVTCRFL